MEQEIRFLSDGIELEGTLEWPEAGELLGAVLLIPGSGQIDRNENGKKFHSNILKDVAVHLSRRRLATLRFDKRGVGRSGGDYWAIGFYDHISDARAALVYLQSRLHSESKPTFVLGHSEGASISIRLAAQEPTLAGAILVAGSAQRGEDTLRWQAARLAEGMTGLNGLLIRLFHINVLEAQAKALKKIENSSRDWIRQAGLRKINAKWMREFLAYDPSGDLKRIRVPILALTGSKDIQVNPADLYHMAEIIPGDFEYHIVPNMTHMLREDAGRPSISKYKKLLSRPLDPHLLDIIDTWLDKRVRISEAMLNLDMADAAPALEMEST